MTDISSLSDDQLIAALNLQPIAKDLPSIPPPPPMPGDRPGDTLAPPSAAAVGAALADVHKADALGKLSDQELMTRLGLPAPQPGFMDRIGEDLSKRGDKATEILTRAATGKTPLSIAPALLATNVGLGAANDVAGETFNAVVPDAVKASITQKAQDTADAIDSTGPGQYLGDKLLQGSEAFQGLNPNVKDLISGIGNAAAFAGGTKPAANMVGAGLDTTGSALVQNAENRVMAGKKSFVQDLISPKETPTVKADQFSRSTEQGLLRNRVVEPTPQETGIIDTVSTLPVGKSKSLLANYNIIANANRDEASNLIDKLKKNDVPVLPAEVDTALENSFNTLKQNPYITGDAETSASRVIDGMRASLAKNENTTSGLLQARKDFDSWVRSQKGGGIFDPTRDSAASIAIQNVRQTINDLVESKVPDIGFKNSLKRQSNLYRAMDNIETKGGSEGKNIFSRTMTKGAALIPVKSGLGKIAALTAGASAAAYAPALAGGAATLYGAGKVLRSPTLQKTLGRTLQGTGKVLNTYAEGGPVKKNLTAEFLARTS